MSKTKVSSEYDNVMANFLLVNYSDAFKYQIGQPSTRAVRITHCPSLDQAEKLFNSHNFQKHDLIFIVMEISEGLNNISSMKKSFEKVFSKKRVLIVFESGSSCVILWKLKDKDDFYCLIVDRTGIEATVDFISQFILEHMLEKQNG